MITDSVLVCHFPRDAFTTVNQKKAEQFLWHFLNEFSILRISSGERWLEIQCGQSVSLKQVENLNTKLKHTLENAISEFDVMQHTKLYLKIMYEMGRLAEGVAQIINVKDSTMCHGVASELLTEVKKFAGHSLPQQLHLYQYQPTNAKTFGYTDIPDVGHINGGALGPTAPMTSTGIHLTDDINSFHHKQQLFNKLTQINYMQQLHSLNAPFGGMNNNNLNNLNNMNMMMGNNPLQYQQQQLLLKQQQLLVQQQLSEINKTSTKKQHAPQLASQTHNNNNNNNNIFASNANNKAMNEINNEYIKLLAEQEAKQQQRNNKKKKKKSSKKKHRKQKSGSSSTSSSSSSTDSDDDDDESDSDDSDLSSSDSDESDYFKDKTKVKRTNSAPKHLSGIGLVDDDEEMKYPPIPFVAATGNDINLDPIMTPHLEDQVEKHTMEFKKALRIMEKKKKRNKKNKKKKKKKDKKSSIASSGSSSSLSESDSDTDDDDDDDDSDSEDDDDSDSDDDDSDDDESRSDEESESDSSDSEDDDEDEDDSRKIKKRKAEDSKFEDDLDLLLGGNIDAYISKNMPLEMVENGMSPKYEEEESGRKRRIRPHSLSIQIKDAQELDELKKMTENVADSEDDDDDENKMNEAIPVADDTEIVGKSYKRKIDRILRGSKSNLDYAKNVLGMVETDRNTPDLHHSPIADYADVVQHMKNNDKKETEEEEKEMNIVKKKKKKQQPQPQNKHKQHLDDMIANIMAGKEFVPFEDDNNNNNNNNKTELLDKARESEDEEIEIETNDFELKAAEAAANLQQNNDINDIIKQMNDDDDDEDVDEMFVEQKNDDDINIVEEEEEEKENETTISIPEEHEAAAAAAVEFSSKNKSFQSLITAALGPTATALAVNSSSGHHKRQSTRLLLDSLRPSTSTTLDIADASAVDVEMQLLDDGQDEDEIMMMITWGMILIELDNFEQLLSEIGMDRNELIEIISTLIDESLEYENQYVDHMTEGQFVLLTPVDIVVDQEDAHRDKDSDYFYKKKEDRLHDIAASVLHHLSQEEEQLEFCMGVALQDRVSSDQEWFEIARSSLDEMKQYREIDRQNHVHSMSLNLEEQKKQQNENEAEQQLFDIDKLRRRSAKYTNNKLSINNNNNKKEEEEEIVIEIEEEEADNKIFNALDNLSAADLDYQDECGDTALIIACGSRQHHNKREDDDTQQEYVLAADLNVVEAIISNGCNVNLRNREGMNALMFAAMYGDNAVVTRLCIAGAKLEIKGISTKYTKTALLFAAENGHQDVCETLLTFGANINCLSDENQSNVLMLCVNNNHIDTIKFFLNYNSAHKLNINHQNKYGYTALMIAAYNGNQYVVQLLIDHGADCNIKNNQNENAYSIARKANHIDLCQLLLNITSAN